MRGPQLESYEIHGTMKPVPEQKIILLLKKKKNFMEDTLIDFRI